VPGLSSHPACRRQAWAAGADETPTVLRAGNDIYSNVTVTTVSSTDIYFTYRGGLGSAELEDFSKR
jgi:hypothetical protein